jgi:hypothetical protein
MDGTLVAVGLLWLSKSLAYLLASFNAVLAMGGKAIGSLKSTLIVVESSLEAKSSH